MLLRSNIFLGKITKLLTDYHACTLPPVQTLLPLAVTPSITDMFHSVHGGRSLHYGAKRTYLALCKALAFPGHGIPLRVIQDLVAECPTCQKDRIPLQLIPHNNIRETLMHHKRTIGIDHVTVTLAFY